jgi:hypothetical protein
MRRFGNGSREKSAFPCCRADKKRPLLGPFSVNNEQALLETLFGQKAINLIFHPRVGGSEELIDGEVRLMEDWAHLGARIKALFTVIMTHTAAPDAAKG